MTSPIEVKLADASTHTGRLNAPGVAQLRTTLRPLSTMKPYADWAKQPFTCLIRKALRDLALNGPRTLELMSAETAYGMTCGLQLAAQLMEDPSAVFDDIFTIGENGKPATEDHRLLETFDTAPDSI